MKRYVVLFFVFLLASLTAGCSNRLGDFTIVSTKNVDIGTNYVLVEKNVEGNCTKPIIIIFPTGYPDIKSAVDDVLNRYQGQLLTDAVIEYSYWYIPFIYGEYAYKVKGDVYKKANKISNMDKTELNAKVKEDVTKAKEFFFADTTKDKIALVEVKKDDIRINPETNKIDILK